MRRSGFANGSPGPRRMMNFATGLAEGTFTVHLGTFTRGG
jgi:hypothetical protein